MLIDLLGVSSAGFKVDSNIIDDVPRDSAAPSVEVAIEGIVEVDIEPVDVNESLLGSALLTCSLLRKAKREKVALIRFSPEALVGRLLLPDLKREAARESL